MLWKQTLRPLLSKRPYSTTPQPSEVAIPVPWGHLSGKWWGPKDQRPIVTFHGWQDNCGSFDRLIPQLPLNNISFLALDFPGHGHSSRLPPGMFYHNLNGVMIIRRLQQYFQWPKMSLMGHSLGAITSYTFGSLFPDSVDFCICIDGLNPLINAKRLDRVTQSIDNYLRYDGMVCSDKDPPVYTFDEMVEMLHKGTLGSIDKEYCKFILERNVTPSESHPGKYFFHRDPRLKSGPLTNWAVEDILEGARRVSFPLFGSKCEKTPVSSNKEYFRQVEEILRQKENVHFHGIKGTHHGHLNTPELFNQIIPEFIDRYKGDGRDLKNVKEIMRMVSLEG